MAAKAKVNWATAQKDYVERRATGEALSFGDYAQELGCSSRAVREHARKENWNDKVAARTADLVTKAWNETEIEQVAIRKAMLAPALVFAETLQQLVMLVRDAVIDMMGGDSDMTVQEQLDAVAALPMKNLRLLQQITKELAEVGGGLPKFHQVTVDDHHGEGVANRKQMQALEQKVREFREWARVHRRGPYAPPGPRGGGGKDAA